MMTNLGGGQVYARANGLPWEQVPPQGAEPENLPDGLALLARRQIAAIAQGVKAKVNRALGLAETGESQKLSLDYPQGEGLMLIVDAGVLSGWDAQNWRSNFAELFGFEPENSDRASFEFKSGKLYLGASEARVGARLVGYFLNLQKAFPEVKAQLITCNFEQKERQTKLANAEMSIGQSGLYVDADLKAVLQGNTADDRRFSLVEFDAISSNGKLEKLALGAANTFAVAEYMGDQAELKEAVRFVENQNLQMLQLNGGRGVGKSRLLHELEQQKRGQAVFLDMSVPPEATDKSVAGCEYFGVMKVIEQLIYKLENLALRDKRFKPLFDYALHPNYPDYKPVKALMEFAKLTDGQKLNLLQNGRVSDVEAWLKDTITAVGVFTKYFELNFVLVADDLHYLADQGSKRLMATMLTQACTNGRKVILSSRPKELNPVGNELIDDLTRKFADKSQEINLTGLPLDSNSTLAKKFAQACLGADKPLTEAAISRIATVANKNPLYWILLLNQISLAGGFYDNGSGELELQEDYQLHFNAAEVNSEVASLLLKYKNDPQVFRLLQILQIFGGEISVPAVVQPVFYANLKQLLGFSDRSKHQSLTQMILQLSRKGLVVAGDKAERAYVKFGGDVFVDALNDRAEFKDPDLIRHVINSDFFTGQTELRQVQVFANLIRQDVALMTEAMWQKFTMLLDKVLLDLFHTKRDYTGVANLVAGFWQTSAFRDAKSDLISSGTIGGLYAGRNLANEELQKLVYQLAKFEVLSLAEAQAVDFDQKLSEFQQIAALFDGQKAADVALVSFFAEDRKQPVSIRHSDMSNYFTVIKNNSKALGLSEVDLALLEAKLAYRDKSNSNRFDAAIKILGAIDTQILDDATELGLSPQAAEKLRLMYRLQYEKLRQTEAFKGMDPDVKNIAAIVDEDKRGQFAQQMEELRGALDEGLFQLCQLAPGLLGARSYTALLDNLIGVYLALGEHQMAAAFAKRASVLTKEAGRNPKFAAQADHFFVVAKIMEALAGLLENKDGVQFESLKVALEQADKAIVDLSAQGVANDDLVCKLLYFDKLRIYQWLGTISQLEGFIDNEKLVADFAQVGTYLKNKENEYIPDYAYAFCGGLGNVLDKFNDYSGKNLFNPDLARAALKGLAKFTVSDLYGELNLKAKGVYEYVELVCAINSLDIGALILEVIGQNPALAQFFDFAKAEWSAENGELILTVSEKQGLNFAIESDKLHLCSEEGMVVREFTLGPVKIKFNCYRWCYHHELGEPNQRYTRL